MNVCLITTPILTAFKDKEELDGYASASADAGEQLGILSLASVLERRGDPVRVVDLDWAYVGYLHSRGKQQPFADLASRIIAAEGADIYGFSSICSSYPLTIRIAQAIKAALADSTILLGGPQATVVDLQTLAAFPFVDFILRGESEATLPSLLSELAGERQ